MILPLFSRRISEKEISQREAHLGIITLVRQKSIDELNSSKSIDLNLLDAVLKMINLAKEQLHISYGKESAVAPLLSLYICRGSILGFEYTRQGIEIIELMALQDVKEILMKYASILPVYDRRADCVQSMEMGREDALRLMERGAEEGEGVFSAQFIVNGQIGPYMVLVDKKTCLEGMILAEKMISTKGSSFPVLQAMNRFVIQMYEKTLKHEPENKETTLSSSEHAE